MDCKVTVTLFVIIVVSISFHSFSFVYGSENSWTSKTPLPVVFSGVVALDNRIYGIGGSGEYNNVTYDQNSVFEYNPPLDEWTFKGIMPTKRPLGDITVTTFQNEIYVIGKPDGLIQIYDPQTNIWQNQTKMPTPRIGFEANVVNGKMYLIGGRTGGQNTTVDLNEVYDLETDSWAIKAPIPYPVVSYASTVVDGKIYVMGGQNEHHLPQDPLNLDLTQIYDPQTDTWSFGAHIRDVVLNAAACTTNGELAPKRIYLVGGTIDGSMVGCDIVQIYDSQQDSWTHGSSMPTERGWLDVAVVNDTIYAMGGSKGLMLPFIKVNEQYIPAGYIPEFPSWMLLPLFVGVLISAIISRKHLSKNS